METKDILLLSLCLVLAGFSLYRRYVKQKKEGDKSSSGNRSLHDTRNTDDYEPYSGK